MCFPDSKKDNDSAPVEVMKRMLAVSLSPGSKRNLPGLTDENTDNTDGPDDFQTEEAVPVTKHPEWNQYNWCRGCRAWIPYEQSGHVGRTSPEVTIEDRPLLCHSASPSRTKRDVCSTRWAISQGTAELGHNGLRNSFNGFVKLNKGTKLISPGKQEPDIVEKANIYLHVCLSSNHEGINKTNKTYMRYQARRRRNRNIL